MSRFHRIDTAVYSKLYHSDECFYIGEYTASGGYKVSETNNQILNLKKEVGSSAAELRWKAKAIDYWAAKLNEGLRKAILEKGWTIIPAPCSKLNSDPLYDDRVLKILQQFNKGSSIDIRPLLVTLRSRPAQHDGSRLSIAELQASMGVDETLIPPPIGPNILVVDDVFTHGGTFAAMRNIIGRLPNVASIKGLFLAKTIWPEGDDK